MLIFETVVNDAAHSGECTLLAPASSNLHLTKRYILGADGRPMKAEDHSKVKQYLAEVYDISAPAKLLHLLRQGRTDLAFIRGVPLPGVDLSEPIFRRIHPRPDEPACFAPCARSWLMADWDGLAAPDGLDLTDPAAVGLHLVEKYLPPEFGIASWVLWFSASHLMPGNEGVIKAHQLFWLVQPMTDEEAKAWLSDTKVDCSLFNPVQLHYCAPPLLEDGVPDPCPRRIHYEESIQGTVDVPADLAERVRPANAGARTREEPRHGWDHPEAVARAEQLVRGFRGVAEGESYGSRGKSGRDNRTKELIGHLWDLGVSLEWACAAAIEWDTQANHPPLGADRVDEIADYHYAGNAQNDPGCKFRPASEFAKEAAAQGLPQAEPGQERDPDGEVAFLGNALEVIEHLNQSYAVITQGANSGRVLCFGDPFEPLVLTPARLKPMLGPVKLVGSDKAGFDVWMNARNRLSCYGIVFEPTGSPARVRPGVFNFYQGWRIKPREGEAHLPFLYHLEHIVCGSNRENYGWLLSWLADMVQRPGKKPGTGVVLFSPEKGTGKTIVVKAIRAVTAPYSTIISKAHHLVGQFNAATARKIFLGVEEAQFNTRPQAPDWGVLNDMVTGDQSWLEHKGVDPMEVSNHAHLMLTTNHEKHLPVDYGDRRWFVLHVLPDRKDDFDYFARIDGAIDDGSLPACLLRFLLDYRYDPRLLRKTPMTAAKASCEIARMRPAGRWWLRLLRGETPDNRAIFEGKPVAKDGVYTAFQNWAIGQRLDADPAIFWRDLRKFIAVEETRPSGGTKHAPRDRFVLFPSLAECRQQFVKEFKFNVFAEDDE